MQFNVKIRVTRSEIIYDTVDALDPEDAMEKAQEKCDEFKPDGYGGFNSAEVVEVEPDEDEEVF